MSVNKQTQGVRTVWWEEDAYSVAVCLLDQSLLPHEVLYLRLTTELEVADEDFDACMKMGVYGAELISDGDMLLTHCNAGALATAGWGTALAPMYVAHKAGKHFHVFVDETRPVLQGARLTAWELQQEGIPLTLITDNMAGKFFGPSGIKKNFLGGGRVFFKREREKKART